MDLKDEAPVTRDMPPNGSRQKRGIINTLYPPGPKPGARGRIKNHCIKFWWCDLLVTGIIVVVTVVPIVYVGIKHIAQSQLNKSTLEVLAQNVTSPTPDSAQLTLYTVAKTNSSHHPTLDTFKADLSLEKNGEPFLVIDIPHGKYKHETPILVDERVNFTNMDAFIEYNKVVLANESFTVFLKGKPKLHLSGLPTYKVSYHQKVTMKGLNKLSGLSISDVSILTIPSSSVPPGTNMLATAMIPNPSVMTLFLGNVTQNLAVDGTPIGTALLPNLLVTPGNNSYPLQGTVDQLAVVGLITSKYQNGILPIDVTGNSSVVNGQHLPYYEAALQQNSVRVNLDVGPALRAIGLNITKGDVEE